MARVVSIQDAAREIGVHEKTISRWLNKREVRLHHRDQVGQRFVDLDDVDPDLVRRAQAFSTKRKGSQPPPYNIAEHELAQQVEWLRKQLEAKDERIRDLIATVRALAEQGRAEHP